MANNHSTLTSLFTDIADAIRAKTGGTEPIVADQFPEAIAAAGGAPLVGAITVADNTTMVEIPVSKKYSHLIMFAAKLTSIPLQTLIDEYENNDKGFQIASMTKEVIVSGAYCGGAYITARTSNNGSVRVTPLQHAGAVGGNPIVFTESKISVSIDSWSEPGASKFAPGEYCYIAW